jgi:hypothetical protein
MIIVLNVLLTEAMLQNVHVMIKCLTIMELVNHVLINVTTVLNQLITVNYVKKTELTAQLVTVHPDFMMMVLILYVQNVTVTVTLVHNLDLV